MQLSIDMRVSMQTQMQQQRSHGLQTMQHQSMPPVMPNLADAYARGSGCSGSCGGPCAGSRGTRAAQTVDDDTTDDAELYEIDPLDHFTADDYKRWHLDIVLERTSRSLMAEAKPTKLGETK